MKRIFNHMVMFVCIIAFLSACGSDHDNGRPPAQNVEIFVANAGNDSVTSYPGTDSGNVAPESVLSTGVLPTGVAIDNANNEIFVTNSGSDSVTVYPRNATGTTVPLRTIAGTKTQLSYPSGIAIDTARNEIFVTDSGSNSVTVYSSSASGDVVPIRTIVGASTGLTLPGGIAVDAASNEVFVVNQIVGGNSRANSPGWQRRCCKP